MGHALPFGNPNSLGVNNGVRPKRAYHSPYEDGTAGWLPPVQETAITVKQVHATLVGAGAKPDACASVARALALRTVASGSRPGERELDAVMD